MHAGLRSRRVAAVVAAAVTAVPVAIAHAGEGRMSISRRWLVLPALLLGGLLVTAVPAVASTTTAPGHTIATAGTLTIGPEETGGGGVIDFWKVQLTGGDQVQFSTTQPVYEPGTAINTNYSYELYAPGTTDSSFPGATPITYSDTFGTANSVFTLRAPSTGTFILAVCENATDNCGTAVSGQSLNPMQPYTFTTTLVGGPETATSLRLSPASITYGHEKILAAKVTVTARFGGRPAGTVTIMAGKKRVCTTKLSRGKGECHPASGSLLRPGKYSIVAFYGGSKSFARSESKAVSLKIRKR